MPITPEVKLYRGVVDRAIIDSLAPPPKELPDYPVSDKASLEYTRVRDQRKTMNAQQYYRNDAKHYLLGEKAAAIHKLCYGVPIDSLKDRLVDIWEIIEQDPSASKRFIKQFSKTRSWAREE